MLEKKYIIISIAIIITTVSLTVYLLFAPQNNAKNPTDSINEIQNSSIRLRNETNPNVQSDIRKTFRGPDTIGDEKWIKINNTIVSNFIDLKIKDKNFFPLIKNSKLYQFSSNEIFDNRVLFTEISKQGINCVNTCWVVQNNTETFIFDDSIFYISSFSKEQKDYWIIFDNTIDSKNKAQIFEESMTKLSKESEFDGKIININEINENNGVFELEISTSKNFDSTIEKISVDFKEKI